MLLFVIINELEQTYLIIATYTSNLSKKDRQSNNSDHETLINSSNNDINQISFSDSTQYKLRKNILHFLLIFINTTTFIYLAIKFSFVLNEIIKCQNENKKLPMYWLHFYSLVTEFFFCFVQLFIGFLSWIFMRRLSTLAAAQSMNSDSTQNQPVKKVNLKRLISLSYPERYYIFVAFLMLLVSSVSNIAVPYFFGLGKLKKFLLRLVD